SGEVRQPTGQGGAAGQNLGRPPRHSAPTQVAVRSYQLVPALGGERKGAGGARAIATKNGGGSSAAVRRAAAALRVAPASAYRLGTRRRPQRHERQQHDRDSPVRLRDRRPHGETPVRCQASRGLSSSQGGTLFRGQLRL